MNALPAWLPRRRTVALIGLTWALGGCAELARLLPPAATGAPAPGAISLEAPPIGQGLQIRLPAQNPSKPLDVERSYFRKLDLDRDVDIARIQIAQGPGAHHTVLLKSDQDDSPDKETEGPSDAAGDRYDLVAGSGEDALDWTFPTAVAIRLKARQQLALRTHYVIAADGDRPNGGEVAVNLWFAQPGETRSWLGVIQALCPEIQQDPAGGAASMTSKLTHRFDHDVHLAAASAASHAQVKRFGVFGDAADRQASPIYQSPDWVDPPFHPLAAGFSVASGSVVSFAAEFAAPAHSHGAGTDHHPEAGEAARVFLFYYPADPHRYMTRIPGDEAHHDAGHHDTGGGSSDGHQHIHATSGGGRQLPSPLIGSSREGLLDGWPRAY